MEHEIKRGETTVTLKMTQAEFEVLYEAFPSQYSSGTAEAAKKIDKALGKIADEL